jgi:hypothetical protein
MQGFLFSKPVPPENVPHLLERCLAVSPPLQPESRSGLARSNRLIARAKEA